jgi:hypothetical protein
VIALHLLWSGRRARIRRRKHDDVILVMTVMIVRVAHAIAGIVVVGGMGRHPVLEHDGQASRCRLQRHVMGAVAQSPHGKRPGHSASDQRDQQQDPDESFDPAHHDGTTFRPATGQPR